MNSSGFRAGQGIRQTRKWAVLLLAAVYAALGIAPRARARSNAPTFYENVLPILQQRCQSCHHAGEISMPLVTYAQTRPYAQAIAKSVRKRTMPPWFADPRFGKFSNNPTLSRREIRTIIAWAAAGAPVGNPEDAPPARHWATGWRIPRPDKVIRMPVPVQVRAHGIMPYTYEIVPTGFTKNEWVQMVQLRPSIPALVHHAVVYVRPPHSHWLPHAPIGVPFTASSLKDAQDRRDARWNDARLLIVYAPGSPPDEWPNGLAKFVRAGADFVFQLHFMPMGHAAKVRASVGMVFAKTPVKHRVVTLQLTNSSFLIPPEASNFPVEAWGTLPNNATLLDIFPHMHLRGKRFEFNIVHKNGKVQTLLYVHYNFKWQLHYKLAKPLHLKAGTKLQAIGWYDNSWKNPYNPDPNVAVRWGDQDFDEMFIGFFDVAISPGENKYEFFVRHPAPKKAAKVKRP